MGATKSSDLKWLPRNLYKIFINYLFCGSSPLLLNFAGLGLGPRHGPRGVPSILNWQKKAGWNRAKNHLAQPAGSSHGTAPWAREESRFYSKARRAGAHPAGSPRQQDW